MRFAHSLLFCALALSTEACERGCNRDTGMTQASTPGKIPAPADVAAAPADAQRTASGLAHKLLQAGTGTTHPAATSRVKVHYTGWTTDGEQFDSSVARGEPIVF